MGVDPISGVNETSAAGTFRSGGSGVPAKIPCSGERSHDRALLSIDLERVKI
jgi:hypothetical protein